MLSCNRWTALYVHICTQREISHTLTLHKPKSTHPRGFESFLSFSPLSFLSPLWCLHKFNWPWDLQDFIVDCVDIAVFPLSIHICWLSPPGSLERQSHWGGTERGVGVGGGVPHIRVSFKHRLIVSHRPTPSQVKIRYRSPHWSECVF